ncbi:MAG: UDP-glucose/GDP-mannose dehydrogenase family protein [Candidatus Uhrbacteria bacterium]|nr:UDP-glucose/GDP-mannose dehydrogenase family protein [Candidatus Uhrbacteria bacterium]
MNITMIGTGYVGLTTGACFADMGHSVTCLDIDEGKIARLKNGECPIFEAGLEDLLKKNISTESISFTTDYAAAIPGADIIFFCIDTPAGEYGKANLSHLLAAAQQCAPHLNEYTVLVNKSTAPVGTARKIQETVRKIHPDASFDIASNPEFLAEGSAVKNFLEPDRIVVGTESEKATELLKTAYAPLIEKGRVFVAVTIPSAELIKYASNSFLAMKLSFINEIADFCELVGADVADVAKGMGLDSRIGSKYLEASIGFGGSCFGKDVHALVMRAQEEGYEFRTIKALIAVNELRYLTVIRKLKVHLGPLKGKTIAVLGLAYKAGTDDVRDSQALRIILELLDSGARVRAYDPEAIENFKKSFSRASDMIFMEQAHDVSEGADALLILTEWDEFRALDLATLKTKMSGNLIVDGRNLLTRKIVEAAGFTYEGIGR